ncbi:hypothetical protein BKK51_13045 [Rodentibacter trehalosifermentans]|uniref:Lipoprotein n=1 Tax=Rodentibacter trehalosifermentans TaxID=1908263 RepID=A0A1V3IKY7_9PAST|nr:hypothetical protein [Rodentibacter trehalosifermentans]OOF42177.1 hypothetical protein BKK51_13045 [Rodentibacter trehalosifermentans]
MIKTILKVVFLSAFLQSCCLGSGDQCFIYKAWDGAYSRERIHTKYEKERKKLYENESEEKKALRKKNELFCNNFATKQFYKIKINYPDRRVNMNDLYINCMRDKGTPEYF